MVRDEGRCALQAVTAAVDLHRRIERAIDEACAVSYLGFCLLASVRTHGGCLRLAEFPRKVLANDNTVIVGANKLARAELVVKTRCSSDGRIAVLEETAHGVRALDRGFAAAYRSLRSSVWADFTEEDVEGLARAYAVEAVKLGIGLVEARKTCHPVLTPACLMLVGALLRRWAQAVKRGAALTLAEYRCLAVLELDPKPLTCASVAEALMVDRSSISVLVAKLTAKELISHEPGLDRRHKALSLTESGKAHVALAASELKRVTVEHRPYVHAGLRDRTMKCGVPATQGKEQARDGCVAGLCRVR